MHRLGSSKTHPRDWGNCTAYYARLTVQDGSGSRIHRDISRYPPPPARGFLPSASPPKRLLRTECLDLGHTQSYFELCKYTFDHSSLSHLPFGPAQIENLFS